MDGLTAFEDAVQGPAKVRQRKVIAQVNGAQQLTQGMAGLIDAIAARSAAESLEHIRGRAPPLIDRGGHTQQVIPPLPNRLEGHVMLYDATDGGRHFEPTRDVQMPVAQAVESWAKIQVQELRDRHPKIHSHGCRPPGVPGA